jgi:TolA-binding protein
MSRPSIALVAVIAAAAAISAQTTEETLAQRQFAQARTFASQGNFKEALGDFQRVVESYPSSSVADNALLEMARYYLERGGDPVRAAALVEQIKSRYSTTESAPDAYVIAGRIELAKSHQPAALDAAVAQFDRVAGVYPESPAVPAALAYAGETLRLRRRLPDARERFQRVTSEYESTPAAAAAHFGLGMVLADEGDYTGAMEEFQRVRDRWPDSREAAVALARASTLFRLYVRAKAGPAFALSADPIGPPKADNVRSLVTTPRDVVYFAAESGVGLLTPPTGERPPAALKPRGLTLDAGGNLVVIEGSTLRPAAGAPVLLSIPQTAKPPRPLDKIEAAVATSSGEWLVMDDDEKVVSRFDASGRHLGTFANARLTRMAINEFDEVAGIDRESKTIAIFDSSGRLMTRLAPRGPGYEFTNPEDLAFDAFGHLYLLDRTAVLVFDYKRLVRPGAARAASTSGPPAGSPVVTIYAEGERSPGAIRRGRAFTVDSTGRLFIADDRAQKIQMYK